MSRPRFIAFLLVLGTLLVYLPVRHHEFVNYDDGGYVTENPTVKAGLTWHGVKWAFTTWVVGNWHPLTMLSHMLDCQLFGLNSGLQHYENACFHTANTVLLFFLLLKMTQRGSKNKNLPAPQNLIWPPAFVAALFAWHPLHVESVAWIAERKDVLSTFFELLALLSYVRFVEEKNSGDGKASKAKIFYAVSLLMFALGLMSKPMLVTMPFVMLLLDFWPLGRVEGPEMSRSATRNLRLAIEKWPFFLLTLIFCGITFWSQHGSGAVTASNDFPFHLRLDNALVSYGRYLLKMIWPANLAVIYPLTVSLRAEQITAAAMALALGVVSLFAWKTRGKFPFFFTGWFWFLGTLVPVIGLVQVGGAAMADRYSYFPSVGIFIIIAFGARDFAARFRLPKILPALAAVFILIACVVLTERQLSFWQNSITLFEHALAVTHDNDIAHSNLGVALEAGGDKAGALAQYHEALRISPTNPEMHNNIANLFYESGETNKALAEYREALRLNPQAAFAWINVGNVDAAMGNFAGALTNYSRASELSPKDPQIPFLIGKILLKQGRDADAISYFRAALRLDPNDFNTLTFMARVLASDEDPQARNGQIALALAAKANDLTGGMQPAIFDTLAMAYAEIGKFDEARQAEAFAIKLAGAAKVTGDAQEMQKRLELYKNHQPFRESFATAPQPKWLK